MSVRSRSWFVLVAATVAAGSLACAGERVVEGACQPVFGGEVCTWGTMVGDDLTAFGATIPMTSVESAPPGGEMVFPPKVVAAVALPEAVARATGFNHLGVNWEPHGHPPGLFLTPHFDFHFYTIDPAGVGAVDCANVQKPAALPAGYTLPDLEIPGLGSLVGLCVPGMGMHSMVEAELGATEPFGASLLVGYYEQKLLFLEPMVAQAKLLDERSFTLAVPSLEIPESAGIRWPVKFEAVYDSTARAYRMVFSY